MKYLPAILGIDLPIGNINEKVYYYIFQEKKEWNIKIKNILNIEMVVPSNTKNIFKMFRVK